MVMECEKAKRLTNLSVLCPEDVFAGVRPEDKVTTVTELQRAGRGCNRESPGAAPKSAPPTPPGRAGAPALPLPPLSEREQPEMQQMRPEMQQMQPEMR